jgi:Bacterial regulatory helix-turn-helix protein, lysR family
MRPTPSKLKASMPLTVIPRKGLHGLTTGFTADHADQRRSRAMHVTQPTASMQMHEINESVGLPLYESIGRKQHLTDAGRRLAQTARNIVGEWKNFEQSIHAMQGLTQGRLRVAVVSTAEYFIPHLLGSFLRKPSAHRHFPGSAQPRWGVLRLREKGSGTRLATDCYFAEQSFEPAPRLELGNNEAIKDGRCRAFGRGRDFRHAIKGHRFEKGAVSAVRHGHAHRIAMACGLPQSQANLTHCQRVSGPLDHTSPAVGKD